MVSLQFQIYYINAMRLKRQSTRRQCVQYNITWHGEKQQWDGDRETISNRDDAPTWYALGSSSTLVMEPYHPTLCCCTRLLRECHLYCHKNMRRAFSISFKCFSQDAWYFVALIFCVARLILDALEPKKHILLPIFCHKPKVSPGPYMRICMICICVWTAKYLKYLHNCVNIGA